MEAPTFERAGRPPKEFLEFAAGVRGAHTAEGGALGRATSRGVGLVSGTEVSSGREVDGGVLGAPVAARTRSGW